MENPSVAPSAPLPEHFLPQQMPSAPPTYAQAVGLQPSVPYPLQPSMPMPVPAQVPVPGQPPMNYMVPGMMLPPQQPIQQHVPQPVQQPATHVATTTVFVGGVPVGPKAVKMTCPMCRADIKTSTVTENQCSAHICCIILFMIGCCLCSCIPYCMDSFKIVRHSCPNCKAYLGTYKP